MFAITKDPGELLDYGFDWTDWLEQGDAISAADWSVTGGLTVESEENTTVISKAWISGGTNQTIAKATNRITTTGGRTAERTLTITIANK